MTSRRNTIQKDLVRNTVYEMRRHVTANEVYEFIKEAYPSIGKGTVYRNLDILVEEGALRKVEVPNGPNRFDFTLKNHYHVRCIKCGSALTKPISNVIQSQMQQAMPPAMASGVSVNVDMGALGHSPQQSSLPLHPWFQDMRVPRVKARTTLCRG